MAIVKMSHVEIFALDSCREAIFEGLSRKRFFEVEAAKDYEGVVKRDNVSRISGITSKQARVFNAIETLKELTAELEKIQKDFKKSKRQNDALDMDYTKPKQPMFFARRDVGFDDLDNIVEQEKDILDSIAAIEDLKAEINAIKSKTLRLQALKDELLPYFDFDTAFSEIKDTKSVGYVFGTMPKDKLDSAKIALSEIPETDILFFSADGLLVSAVFGMSDIAVKETMLTKLNDYGFAQCPLVYGLTPKAQYEEFEKQIKELTDELYTCLSKAGEISKVLPSLEIYHDYFALSAEKAQAIDNCNFTEKTFLLEGWVQDKDADEVKNTILKISPDSIVNIRPPEKDEIPPTLTKNGVFADSFVGMTNDFSAPKYTAIDHNLIMAIFYIIFYGLMIGDAGYGFILSAASGAILFTQKLEKGTKRMMKILFFGGISSIVWGLIFGSVFAIDGIPKLIDPISDSIMLIGICIAMGVVHILFGLGVKFAEMAKNGKTVDAIMDVGSLYLLFLGAALIVINMLLSIEPLGTAGMIVAIAGLAFMVLTQGRGNKGILGKALGGLGSLYGLINYVSDVLSYLRLFCLCIVGGAIGLVTNMIASVLISFGPFAIPIAVVITVALHGFNLALSALSAYIHDARLQYIEFFGKFDAGGGRAFAPMGNKTRYVVAKQNESVQV